MANTDPAKSQGPQILALLKENDDQAGQATFSRLNRLDRTLQILLTNSRELDEQLDFFADPHRSFHLWAVDHRSDLTAFLAENARLLHNYLASVKTLVDHTRHEMNGAYKETELLAEYQERVKDLFAVGSPAFIQCLRNYTLHYRLADEFAQLHHSPGQDFETGVHLDRDRLLEWKNWSAAANTWLAEQPERIDFRDPLNDYEARVLDFYQWVDKRIRIEHTGELADVEAIQEQIQSVLSDAPKLPGG